MEFWDEKMETMSRDEMTAFQGARLGETVKYAYDNTDFYRKKLDGAGIAPEDIRSPSFDTGQETLPALTGNPAPAEGHSSGRGRSRGEPMT